MGPTNARLVCRVNGFGRLGFGRHPMAETLVSVRYRSPRQRSLLLLYDMKLAMSAKVIPPLLAGIFDIVLVWGADTVAYQNCVKDR